MREMCRRGGNTLIGDWLIETVSFYSFFMLVRFGRFGIGSTGSPLSFNTIVVIVQHSLNVFYFLVQFPNPLYFSGIVVVHLYLRVE